MKEKIGSLVIILCGIAITLFLFSAIRPFRLGLDLSGGTLLTYRANVEGLDSSDVPDAMNSLRDVIERRVNLFGVSEPTVQVEKSRTVNEERLIVELPGVTNVNEAVEALGETPFLEFKLLDVTKFSDPNFENEIEINPELIESLYVETGLGGRHLERAQVVFDNQSGAVAIPIVSLDFNDEGAELFAQITRENVGVPLAIILDGVVISEPVIQGEITGGNAVITGSFAIDEARDLARNLNFGALPVPIELVGTQAIGAVLGEQIFSNGIRAGIFALVFISLFMILWYRIPGVVAVLALLFYTALTLLVFKLLPVTLTAAGLAGFILSLGMAVDANVLVFERLKEELKGGKSVRDAIEIGFRRAWLSIRDGNVTTLIAALILFYMTTSLVQGFALTLGIGVLISMFSAVTVTRTLLLAVASERSRFLFGSGLRK